MGQEHLMNLSLDEIIHSIQSKFPVEVESVTMGNRVLKVLQVKDEGEYLLQRLEEILGPVHPDGALGEETLLRLMEVQWWMKIWEPSFVLALFMGTMPPKPGEKILEIGAGSGIVGIYAALCGHDVTISDIQEDALLCARANAMMNGLPDLPVVSFDWCRPYSGRPFEVIIGSEVVYDRRSYDALISFLDQALAPGGTIFLAKNRRLHTPLFFEKLVRLFKFKEKVVRLSGAGETLEVSLYAIKRRSEG